MARRQSHKKQGATPLPSDLKETLRQLRWGLLPAALPLLASSGLNVLLMLMIKESMDAALAGNTGRLKDILLPMLLGVVAFLPVELMSAWMRGRYIRRINQTLKGRYIDRIFAKNISEFQNEHLALYLSNITNDMNSVEQRYFISMHEILRRGLGALAGVIILLNVHWGVAATALIPGIIVAWVALRSGRGLEKHEGERSGFLKDYTVYIREVLSAFRIIRNNNLEKKIADDFDRKSASVQQKRFELDRAETIVNVRNNILFGLMIAGLLIAAMFTVRAGLTSTGGLILIINGYSNILNAFGMVAEGLPLIRSERPVFLRMEEALSNQETLQETETLQSFDKSLAFDRVSFAYGENQVLRQASFSMRRGGKYLLVGPSGGGKSTVLRLIRKYFNPHEGKILIDGQSLAAITRESYYKHLANVEQQVFLFEDTLRNNLTLFKPYRGEDIMEAIQGAGLSGFLASLPDGLDSMIHDNGKNLSGGEKARIAIARGLIARADLLLLDEAFASLDEETARGIEQTLLALEGVTVISVSHVIFSDTAPLYDAVFEVKRGQVSERVLA
ncbi:MAG: ABC transporter ATP-binding protein [Clostridiaceae bacterium]|nr:ABC transporter ATP-binding protein [Clostridiaceae bacterium]